MTWMLWLALSLHPQCFELGMWLTGCQLHVLNLSVCEQRLLWLCRLHCEAQEYVAFLDEGLTETGLFRQFSQLLDLGALFSPFAETKTDFIWVKFDLSHYPPHLIVREE